MQSEILNCYKRALDELEQINRMDPEYNLRIVDGMTYDRVQRPLDVNPVTPDRLRKPPLDYVRLRTLQLLAQEVKTNGLSGEIAEAGVYRGFFAGKLNALLPDRTLHLFDTFSGFRPEDIRLEQRNKRVDETFLEEIDAFGNTGVDLVLSSMPHPEMCRVYPGRIPETFQHVEEDRFCLVSIDLDFYDATFASLAFFYPRLVPKGYILLHDYNHAQLYGVKQALADYRKTQPLNIVPIPDEGGTVVIVK